MHDLMRPPSQKPAMHDLLAHSHFMAVRPIVPGPPPPRTMKPPSRIKFSFWVGPRAMSAQLWLDCRAGLQDRAKAVDTPGVARGGLGC